MAVVNPMLSPIVYQATSATTAAANVKDSRWLTLDVCREFTRNKCSRTEDECRFAHPPPNVEVQNGRVMCCFDSIKGKCQRRDPPCKYLHPPQHLKEQLLQNGRNNLILKHLQMQMMAHAMPSVYPIMYDMNSGKSFSASYIPMQGQDSYMVQRYFVPVSGPTCYSPYYATAAATPYAALPTTAAAAPAGLYAASSPVGTSLASGQAAGLLGSDGTLPPQQLIIAGDQQNGIHTDRNENGVISVGNNNCGSGCVGTQNGVQCPSPIWHTSPSPSTAGGMLTAADTVVTGANYTSPVYFQAPSGIPGAGMVPIMKPAGSDNGKCVVPFYQPATVAYQQMALSATMQLQPPAYVPFAITGHSPVEPRY